MFNLVFVRSYFFKTYIMHDCAIKISNQKKKSLLFSQINLVVLMFGYNRCKNIVFFFYVRLCIYHTQELTKFNPLLWSVRPVLKKKQIYVINKKHNCHKAATNSYYSELKPCCLTQTSNTFQNENLRKSPEANGPDHKDFERYLVISHYYATRSSAMAHKSLDSIATKLSVSMLRHTDIVPADKAFFEAGMMCRVRHDSVVIYSEFLQYSKHHFNVWLPCIVIFLSWLWYIALKKSIRTYVCVF